MIPIELLLAVCKCCAVFAACILPCVLVLIPIRFFTKLPSFIFRKLMHTVAFSSAAVMILTASGWQPAACTFLLGAVTVWPVLSVLERRPWYARLLTEKKPGEVKKSLAMYFAMLTILVSVLWGFFHLKIFAAASVIMWGTGDAAAALVGIPFGKHKIPEKISDGKKSWEGSLAMILTVVICGSIVMTAGEGMSLPLALLYSSIGAIVGTIAEVTSPGELDTVTVPASIAVALLVTWFFIHL